LPAAEIQRFARLTKNPPPQCVKASSRPGRKPIPYQRWYPSCGASKYARLICGRQRRVTRATSNKTSARLLWSRLLRSGFTSGRLAVKISWSRVKQFVSATSPVACDFLRSRCAGQVSFGHCALCKLKTLSASRANFCPRIAIPPASVYGAVCRIFRPTPTTGLTRGAPAGRPCLCPQVIRQVRWPIIQAWQQWAQRRD